MSPTTALVLLGAALAVALTTLLVGCALGACALRALARTGVLAPRVAVTRRGQLRAAAEPLLAAAAATIGLLWLTLAVAGAT